MSCSIIHPIPWDALPFPMLFAFTIPQHPGEHQKKLPKGVGEQTPSIGDFLAQKKCQTKHLVPEHTGMRNRVDLHVA